jgi:hypothetical protein
MKVCETERHSSRQLLRVQAKLMKERVARGAVGGRMIEVIFSVAGIFPARSADAR